MRIGSITRGLPKSFLRVGSESLIARLVRLARRAGIDDVTLVTGFREDLFRATFPECTFVRNRAYRDSNTAMSLELALRLDESEPILLMNGDVYVEDGLFERVMASGRGTLAAVKQASVALQAVKVCVEGERITRIGNDLACAPSFGEALGVYHLAADFARALKRTLWTLDSRVYYECGMDRLLVGGHQMALFDVGDAVARGIDMAADYYELLARVAE